jgi:squalene-hopene/tetraprenyl-beta-curcumene cyclase
MQTAPRSIASTPVTTALEKSQQYLLSLQTPDGYWWAHLESNVTITAEAVLLFKLWGIADRRPMAKAQRYLQRHQVTSGGWELYAGDGGDLSTSIEAYMALRLLGVSVEDPDLIRAKRFILSKGGLTKARIFTKLHLALIGCYDWRGLPSLPPWVMLLPNEISPVTIYEMSSWARGSTVPLMIVLDRKPVWLTQPMINLDELYLEGKNAKYSLPSKGDWTDVFVWADQAFKLAEQFSLVPFRDEGLKAAEAWVVERQEASGDWGGIIPAMLNSLLALKCLNYDVHDPIVSRGIAAIDRFAVETDDEYWVQPCVSPVWDTALVMRSLSRSGVQPNHTAMKRACDWLIKMQILDYGDWSVKNRKGAPGAWAFEFDNRFYPDVDDTAVVVMALLQAEASDEKLKQRSIDRAVKWISTMQCKPGGWAAFDLDNDQNWLNDIPYGDLRAMIDPNTADVTARVLEMMGQLHHADIPQSIVHGISTEQIDRALTYLMQEQEPEGCWFGRWGVNYIYGTSGVLAALETMGKITQFRSMTLRAIQWLINCQNEDGGWGETCESYKDRSLMGQGDSTPSQTAWAVMGLLAGDLAVGHQNQPLREQFETTIDHGIAHLIQTQSANGSWDEIWHTGTGFPQHFYLKYHLYRQHFPLSAIARYRQWKSVMLMPGNLKNNG